MRWTDELLDHLRTVGDVEVDQMVGNYLRDHGTRASEMLTTMIRRDPAGDGGPRSEIDDWLAERPQLPQWHDARLLAGGARFFEQYGPEVLLSLLLASLPECYAARKGVQVLYVTQRLVSDLQRRLVETAQMVVRVLLPKGLEPGNTGYKTARQVRLMHSGIRFLVLPPGAPRPAPA